MTKHTPATPLPFTVTEGRSGKFYVKQGDCSADCMYDEQFAKDMAHAANAYPRSIRAIKAALCFLEGKSEDPQHIVAMRLRNALRELGEAA